MVCDQMIPENGKYSFEIEYDCESGQYAMRIASNMGTKATTDIFIITGDALEVAYSELNRAAETDNFEDFKNIINTKRAYLNFGFSLSDEKALDAELKDYFAYVKKNPLSAENEVNNTKIFKTYMTAYMLNRTVVENIDVIINELYFEDAELLADYNEIAETVGIQKYFTDKMSGKAIENLEDFEKAVTKAIVLTQIRYADGVEDVKTVLSKYGKEVGITNTASDKVYRQLAGNDFENCNKVNEKIKELSENSNTGGGGSSSGGGGGSSSGGGGKPGSFEDRYKFEDFENIKPEIPETIKMSFEDLDGVMWASEAILALADKGIINGKADGIFAPDDNVTREEFAKLLVSAMGLDNGQTVNNGFIDVDGNAWYARYVNIAKNAGIVNGIGNGKFGTGMPITREDMVVMIFNALKSRDVSMELADVTFNDASMISDYAVNAVGALYKMGAVNGVSETEFAPKGIASRAQAAKIIYGVLDYLQ